MPLNFKIESEAKYFETSFKKDKEGREIFSPWGYGETYFVDEAAKKNIVLWMRIFLWLFIFSIPFLFLWGTRMYDGIFGPNWIFIVSVSVFCILGILMNYILVRELKLSSENFEDAKNLRFKKSTKFSFIFFIVTIFLGWSDNPHDMGPPIALFLMLIVLPVFLFLFKKRNGYIFTKNIYS